MMVAEDRWWVNVAGCLGWPIGAGSAREGSIGCRSPVCAGCAAAHCAGACAVSVGLLVGCGDTDGAGGVGRIGW
jgi:hypothetical protein